MEENIVYNLNSVNLDRNTNVDIHQLYEDYSINFSDEDEQLAYEMNNLYNCNVGELKKIIEYYNIHDEQFTYKLNKKRKDEIINTILDYEKDIDNSEIVYRRKRLWLYLKELKSDKYLSKYIIFN
jgi:hypothetical protein